jgi:hypothetical protein
MTNLKNSGKGKVAFREFYGKLLNRNNLEENERIGKDTSSSLTGKITSRA